MKKIFLKILLPIIFLVSITLGLYYKKINLLRQNSVETPATELTNNLKETEKVPNNIVDDKKSTPVISKVKIETPKIISKNIDYLNDSDLLSLADNKYSSGEIPLGDDKYTTSAPRKGYIYLCSVHKDNPGSMVSGPWIHGSTWNFLSKYTVDGSVSWPNASFSQTFYGIYRVLSGNDLPINHTTGVFPVQSTDDAYGIDKNPNTISVQNIKETLPINPVYSDVPYCMGMEVGVMLSGVNLFNGFDAGLRDAQAHELQDSCSGHPQGEGQYHYHGLSQCFKDISVKTVLGFAYDGFPITGPKVAENKYLTTEDLDVCHGIKSEIILDGKKKITYHYVLTQDFPYSASCFRAKPVRTWPSASGGVPSSQNNTGSGQAGSGQGGPTPPQEALSACSGKLSGVSCSFVTPMGDTISGVCDSPPGSGLACIPR